MSADFKIKNTSRDLPRQAQGRVFVIHVVHAGDRYGGDDQLVHEKEDPLIEVWDTTYAGKSGFDDEKGQFVSRYYASTLARGGASAGIDLMGYEPAWKIDADAFAPVRKLAKRLDAGFRENPRFGNPVSKRRRAAKEPTREELEAEAHELGIKLDPAISDGGLMLRIAQAYARRSYEAPRENPGELLVVNPRPRKQRPRPLVNLTDEELIDLAYGTDAQQGQLAREELNERAFDLTDKQERKDFGDWLQMKDRLHRHRAGNLHGAWEYGPRKNPSDDIDDNPAVKKAAKTYQMWHKKEPKHASILDTGCDGDDEMVCVGKACDIVYRSGKWEKGRKTNDYIHTFDSKPSVYMLGHLVDGLKSSGGKTVESLLAKAKNADGQFAVAELAIPLSFSLQDGTDAGQEIAIHVGAKVYGAVDKKTVIITDPHWRLIVIKGGEMHFDERGIVK